MSSRGAALPVRGESICPYCGVGCRLELDGEVGVHSASLRIRGVAEAPANLGRLCAKGALLGDTIATPDRLTVPLVRPSRGAELRPASWDDALGRAALRFRQVLTRHGPEAVAFYGSGQLGTESA